MTKWLVFDIQGGFVVEIDRYQEHFTFFNKVELDERNKKISLNNHARIFSIWRGWSIEDIMMNF